MRTGIFQSNKAKKLEPNKICVDWVQEKGRFVIAKTNIHKMESIEISPASKIPADQIELINGTDVFEHYFVNPEYHLNPKLLTNGTGGYIAYGLASMCSHSKKPNAIVNWLQDEMGVWAELVALEAIKEGEAIEISYTNIDSYLNADEFI